MEATYEVALLEDEKCQIVHVGNSEEEIEIKDLCKKIFKIANYDVEIENLPKTKEVHLREDAQVQKNLKE